MIPKHFYILFFIASATLTGAFKPLEYKKVNASTLFPVLSKNQKDSEEWNTQRHGYRRAAMLRPWTMQHVFEIYNDNKAYIDDSVQRQLKMVDQVKTRQRKLASEKSKKEWAVTQADRSALFKELFGSLKGPNVFAKKADEAKEKFDDVLPAVIQQHIGKFVLSETQEDAKDQSLKECIPLVISLSPRKIELIESNLRIHFHKNKTKYPTSRFPIVVAIANIDGNIKDLSAGDNKSNQEKLATMPRAMLYSNGHIKWKIKPEDYKKIQALSMAERVNARLLYKRALISNIEQKQKIEIIPDEYSKILRNPQMQAAASNYQYFETPTIHNERQANRWVGVGLGGGIIWTGMKIASENHSRNSLESNSWNKAFIGCGVGIMGIGALISLYYGLDYYANHARHSLNDLVGSKKNKKQSQ